MNPLKFGSICGVDESVLQNVLSSIIHEADLSKSDFLRSIERVKIYAQYHAGQSIWMFRVRGFNEASLTILPIYQRRKKLGDIEFSVIPNSMGYRVAFAKQMRAKIASLMSAVVIRLFGCQNLSQSDYVDMMKTRLEVFWFFGFWIQSLDVCGASNSKPRSNALIFAWTFQGEAPSAATA